MTTFFIKKNSDLPKLMVEVLLDGRNLYNRNDFNLTGSTVYFSMIDKTTGIKKILKDVVNVNQVNDSIVLTYQFNKTTIKKTGSYLGEFFIQDSYGNYEILPIKDQINIEVIDSIFDGDSANCCISVDNTVVIPSPSPTSTPTNTPTPHPSITPIPTRTQTQTPTTTQTPSVTPSITPTISNTPTNTNTPSVTNTITPTTTTTPTNTNTPSVTNTQTPTNTQTSTNTPTPTNTKTPTQTPTNTLTPTQTPTLTPTNTPNLDGFNYPDFSSISGLELVGPYVTEELNELVLTSPTVASTGNLYRSTSIRYDRNFSIEWKSYIGGGTGADGYCIQWTTTNNTNGLGGGGIGRITDSSTINSIGFYTLSFNNFQWWKNNVLQSTDSVSVGYWRQVLYFWGDYIHSSQTFNLYFNTINSKPPSPNKQYTSFVFDSTPYYIGFGAATGGSQDYHNILKWNLTFT